MVDYRVQGPVAVLQVNNPPVNAISSAVRQGLVDGIDKASADPRVKCVVICGKGRTFPAGADIREFSGLRSGASGLHLVAVCDHIEQCKKPVVAAIHGTALGGGLEISLASHYRVALKSARVGFPEVNIGILPGAAGTQRLPRVAGMKVALDMIPTGRHVTATEAAKYGILDKIVEGNILAEGIKFAQSIMNNSLNGHVTSQRPIRDVEHTQALVEAATQLAKKKKPGQIAPIFNIKSVEAASKFPFQEGLIKEAEYSSVLFNSSQAKALQYAFFAERAATKWEIPGVASYKTVKPQQIRSVAVIGAGTMGSGIAMAILNAGLPTYLCEQDKKFLDNGVKTIRGLYEGSVRLGKLSAEAAKRNFSKLKPTLSYDDLKDVDLVIEAVFENMELKKQIFAKLDKICNQKTLLCTNTSTLSIDEIASVTSRPDRVMGTHFFVPAYHMRLLENIYGEKTSPQTIATITKFSTDIGKLPVLVGNIDAFVGNRMGNHKAAESIFMVEEGALPHEVDQVMEDYGFPMGPFKVNDLSGLDLGVRIAKERAKANGWTYDKQTRYMGGRRVSQIGAYLVDEGRYGRKNGKGFYRYDKPGGKVAYRDENVTALIQKFRKDNGIKPKKFTHQEILERCLYGLINEGFRLLEQGIASKPEDIDVIWFYGFGWPIHTGGPMFYANQVGLRNVYDRICYFQKQHPTSQHWLPSNLLRKLADKNVPIQKWTQFIRDSKL